MTQLKSCRRYVAASVLTLCLLINASSNVKTYATDIEGIRPDGNIYNIEPSAINGEIGYRKYRNFNLSEGDIANLIFKYGEQNVSKFLNLVDNTININGIVNSMRDGKFYNGDVIFISPNGMVVGASGVINVGSLSVLTPDEDTFKRYKGNLYQTAQLFQDYNPVLNDGNGTVTINGKVIARNNIDIQAADILVNQGAGMLAGVNDSTALTTDAQAQALFNQIVNTDNMNIANAFVLDNGNISLRSYGANGGTTILSDMTNYGKGDIKIDNVGSKGVVISAKTSNREGNTTISNSGRAGVSVNGNITNNGGNLTIDNTGANGITINGLVEGFANGVNANNGLGNVNIENTKGSVQINGTVKNTGNGVHIKNSGDAINIASTGKIDSIGAVDIINSGDGGVNIEGQIVNVKNQQSNLPTNGTTTITNSGKNGINLASNGRITNNDGLLTLSNTGNNGINIKGKTSSSGLKVYSKKGNVVIGDDSDNDYYMTSFGDADFELENASLLNYGVAKTLIAANGNFNAKATDGTIGTEVGACDGGICTGIGVDERDLTKSINFKVDGNVNAETTKANKTEDLVINMASLNADMHVDRIKADGRAILLADASEKGSKAYDIVNSTINDDLANVEGKGISIIASGNIGSQDKALTFLQTGADLDIAYDDENGNHVLDYQNRSKYGVDMLAIKDINVKGMDGADGSKVDTNVCTMVSREGSINAEFSGETYIRDITAKKEINIVDRGPSLYIDNLGVAPSRYAVPGDYYGGYEGLNPEKATLKVLDLGTPENPNVPADSTLVVKNGTLNGKGDTKHSGVQDVTVTADNAYIGGYYFNMGKHRMPGLSTVTPDDTTNQLISANPDNIVSIRGRAVRPEDAEKVGQDPDTRNYYYGYDPSNGETQEDGEDGTVSGSGQRDDEDFDKDKEDGDDLVVPDDNKGDDGDDDDDDDDPNPPVGDDDDDDPNPPAGDDDDDDPNPPAGDDDDDPNPPVGDDDDDPNPPAGDDDDDPNPPAGDDDDDPNPPVGDDDDDPNPPVGDDDDDPNPPAGDDDDDPNPPVGDDDDDPNPPVGDDDDDPTPAPNPNPNNNVGEEWGKNVRQRVVDENVESIDKRQFMRFNVEDNTHPISMTQNDKIVSLIDISRGGIAVRHNNDLKVGDVIPVNIQYADMNINADVKVVTANDVKAGAMFVNLDEATANRLLYLNMLLEDNTISMN